MQELITKLGIEWQSLLFQVINFLILLFVLQRFVYKPLVNVLEARRKRVEESMKKTEQIDKELEQTQAKREEILSEAQHDAHGIREQANKDAEKIRLQKVNETRKEIESLLIQARAQIKEEKERALSSVRKEAATLIMLATEKVLRERLDEPHDTQLIERSVEELMK